MLPEGWPLPPGDGPDKEGSGRRRGGTWHPEGAARLRHSGILLSWQSAWRDLVILLETRAKSHVQVA